VRHLVIGMLASLDMSSTRVPDRASRSCNFAGNLLQLADVILAEQTGMTVLFLRLRLACLAALALIVAGCGSPASTPTYDREAAAQIKRIGVLTPRMPNIPAVVLATSPGKGWAFGWIGAAVDGVLEGERKARFEKAVQGQNFSAQDALTESLIAGLQARGYDVARVPARRDKGDFLSTYPTDHAPAVDAYLDVVTNNYGYRAAGTDDLQPYLPWVELRFRLIRARDGAVLMQKAITYNPVGDTKNIVTIAADSTYQFVNSDLLVADPPRAVQGMREALERSGQAVGPLLN
jgi:hypothetical protein